MSGERHAIVYLSGGRWFFIEQCVCGRQASPGYIDAPAAIRAAGLELGADVQLTVQSKEGRETAGV